jgi:hypothetical protein
VNRRALVVSLEALADDLGRLHRVATVEGEYVRHLIERLCARVEDLAATIGPTAADACRLFVLAGMDEDEAAAEALVEVDRWRASLRSRMGLDEDGRLP